MSKGASARFHLALSLNDPLTRGDADISLPRFCAPAHSHMNNPCRGLGLVFPRFQYTAFPPAGCSLNTFLWLLVPSSPFDDSDYIICL